MQKILILIEFIKPPKSLLKPVGKAIADYGMIKEGDRILIGVSGGKDSLSLLQILAHIKTYAPVQFDIGVITVDPEVEGFDPSSLTDYYDKLGVKWFYEKQPIMEDAKTKMQGDSFCAYCARIKRGIMYRVCREQGYNVLALAQHLDDLAESFMMSAFHQGKLETMKAHYINDADDVRVIRPVAYVRESKLAEFAHEAGLPIIPDSCPACFTAPSQRAYFKQMLLMEEKQNTHLFGSLLNAMKPLMGDLP